MTQKPSDPMQDAFGDPLAGVESLPDPATALPQSEKADTGHRDMMRLAHAVEESGLVDDDMLKAAMNRLVDESAASLKQALIQMDFAREEDILEAYANDLGMETVDLDTVNFSPELIEELSPKLAEDYRVIPVRSSETELWLAIGDPSNLQATDDLSQVLGKEVHAVIATEDQIDKAIKKYYQADDYANIYEELAESDNPTHSRDYASIEIGDDDRAEADTPLVVRYVDAVFKKAVQERASDIHVEPGKYGLNIRFRIDGVLQDYPSPPRQWQNAITSRLKVLSGMDLAEKRVPLDGRIKLNLPGRKLDLRVSTLPSLFGESIVMRILDAESVMMGLGDVGFMPDNVAIFNDLIRTPNGVILMCGPTGSGKTTTLYAALSELNTPETKIVTLEDPVEYQLAGVNQIQINADIGLTFPHGLRAVLRQSPNVILVGEIRDLETAANAIEAALTGHLVFSTLHTNDAASSTTRLIDMGIKPYLVAGSLQASIAQRLVRRICGHCKQSHTATEKEIRTMGFEPEEYQESELFSGPGCERCGKTGYRGRTAIHEIMVVDAELRRKIIRSEPSNRLKKYAISQGMQTLRMDGWEKILLGHTTVEEVFRIVGGED